MIFNNAYFQSKWQNRQESIRLDTMKVTLEQERNGLLEQVNREKVVVQQAKVLLS